MTRYWTFILLLYMFASVCLIATLADDGVETFTSRISGKRPVLVTQDDLIYYCGLSSEVPNSHKIFNKTSTASQEIRANFTLDHFVEIDDVGETFTVAGNLVFKWDALCWSEEFYEIVKIASGGLSTGTAMFARDWTSIFHPRMRLRNSVKDAGMTDGFNIYLQTLSKNGLAPDEVLIGVSWTISGLFEATCDLMLREFPFDVQECKLEFASHAEFVNLTSAVLTVGFMGSKVVSENSAWDMKGSTIMTIPSGPGTPTQAIYKFTWQRRPTYYILNMFLPTVLITLLGFFGFLLPGKMPDRSSYAITVLLAHVFNLNLVLSNVPRTPQRIFLIDYILRSALICTFCTAESILMCWFIRGFPVKANLKCQIYRKERCSISLNRFIDLLTFAGAFTGFIVLNASAINVTAHI